MENIQEISIDILDNHSYNTIYATQYDNCRTIFIDITEDGEPYDLTGLQASFNLKKPDGKIVLQTCEIVENRVKLTLSKQVTVVYGNRIPFQIELFTDEQTITTVNGYLKVGKAVAQTDEVVSTDEFTTLSDILMEFQHMIDRGDILRKIDKDVPNGVPSLDENGKVPNSELNVATLTSSGITQLSNALDSESESIAATSKAVNTLYTTMESKHQIVVSNDEPTLKENDEWLKLI